MDFPGLLGALGGTDGVWLGVALGSLTLLFEDVALGLGAALISERGHIEVPVYAGLFAGIVVGDLGLYAAGRWLRGLRFVRRMQETRAYAVAGETFNRAPTTALVLARLVPASRLPVFMLAGVCGYPLGRFTLTILPSVALWTALILYGGSTLLAWLHRAIGMTSLELVLLAVGGYASFRLLFRQRGRAIRLRPLHGQPVSAEIGRAGMPLLDLRAPFVSFFEFWPIWRFYGPLGLYMFTLAIRHRGATLITATNPGFPLGGLVGESKVHILGQLRDSLPVLVPRFTSCRRGTASVDECLVALLECLEREQLALPLVVKPDIGCRGAGVRKVSTVCELRAYVEAFPADQAFIVQELVACEGEAGIFYARDPDSRAGRVISITLKYFPEVTGDGRRTLAQLIDGDPRARILSQIYLGRFAERLNEIVPVGETVRLAFAGNHSKGTIFRNGNALITPALEALFDQLAAAIPGFFFGRFDIRFSDFREIQAGKPAFRIIELNGAGAEVTHVWDSRTTLLRAWRDVAAQYRLAWEIGAKNRAGGARPAPLIDIVRAWKHESAVSRRYPPTL